MITNFFEEVLQCSVVAVVSEEVGVPSLERMLQKLTVWSDEKLTANIKIESLCRGRVIIYENKGDVLLTDYPNNHIPRLTHIWGLVEMTTVDQGTGQMDRVYAAYNMGREGWCILTSNLHTMIHVVIEHTTYTIEQFPDHRKCPLNCT
ncbi:hypothetical protein Pmani_013032 [Petrolisthes manimaculis]|uniref:Uncharacterized protein n=1 Tax=Petrolisthes manimaculis TaxID=1843537 RepID=A0AAE1UEI0_9EUCA|nr:hypothetical protein Pmani_013032 [Petrolisthes manimaculis]